MTDPMSAWVDTLAQRLLDDIQPKLDAALAVRPRLLNVEQAATYLGRSSKAVRHLIASHTLPVVKTDGRVLLDIQDLDTWIAQNKT